MASLINIPNELTDEILAHISGRDVITLSITCKALRAVMLPAVYRNIYLSWDLSATERSPRITFLMRTILEHPTYALHIKSLEIFVLDHKVGTQRAGQITKTLTTRGMEEDQRMRVEKTINELQLPHTEKWISAIVYENDVYAITAFVLALCTQLESLIVNLEFLLAGGKWLSAMLKHAITATSEVTPLAKFDKFVHLAVHDDTSDLEVLPRENPLLLSFYLPKLASLQLPTICTNKTDDYVSSFWPLQNPPIAASLTTLRLHRCNVPADTVSLLLKQTPKLRSLVYECRLPSSTRCLDVKELRQGLNHVQTTLSHLTIRHDIICDEAIDVESLGTVVTGSIGSLRDFTNLAEVNVSLAVLFGQTSPKAVPPLAEVLPPGIQRLTINDDLWNFDALYAWVGEPVMALLKAFFNEEWKTATPQLQECVLDIRHYGWLLEDYWGQQEQQEEIRQICENQGTRFLVLYKNTD